MTHSAVKGFGKAFLVANNTHFILEKIIQVVTLLSSLSSKSSIYCKLNPDNNITVCKLDFQMCHHSSLAAPVDLPDNKFFR